MAEAEYASALVGGMVIILVVEECEGHFFVVRSYDPCCAPCDHVVERGTTLLIGTNIGYKLQI